MATTKQTTDSQLPKVGKLAESAISRGHEVKLKVKLTVKPKSAGYRRRNG